MPPDIRWKQRFENLDKAFKRLQDIHKIMTEEAIDLNILRIAYIGAFMFTFELSWKTLKDFLKYNGVAVSLPRDVIKMAFHHGLIEDGQVWIDMLEDRNLMAHSYDEEKALAAANGITERYIKALEHVHTTLSQRL